MSRNLLLSIALCVGICHAFFEDLDVTPADANEARMLNFNDDILRCYKESATNVSATGYEGPLATCCIRDFWSTCIRAVPVAKECHPAIEARIEEFESSMVGEIECVEVDTRLCPHIEGHHHYHHVSRERSQRYTGAASTVSSIGAMATLLTAVALAVNAIRPL